MAGLVPTIQALLADLPQERREFQPFDRLTPRSKSRNIREWQSPAAHMHAAKFGAPVQGWENLARIEKPLVVEGALQALLLVEIGLREHHRHEVALFNPDAVLAGEHAADLDAEFEDVGSERLRALQLAGPVGVVEDQ